VGHFAVREKPVCPLNHVPALDLYFERQVDLTPDEMWRAWTNPALMVQWFTPAPLRTLEAEMDARPGGRFRTMMAGPEGPTVEGDGCVLAAEPGARFAWTNAMRPGFRPLVLNGEGDFPFVAELSFESRDGGTHYCAVARHATPEDRERHGAMNFEEGWGAALAQMVTLMQGLRG